jgi:hypothetical protein
MIMLCKYHKKTNYLSTANLQVARLLATRGLLQSRGEGAIRVLALHLLIHALHSLIPRRQRALTSSLGLACLAILALSLTTTVLASVSRSHFY